MKLANHRPFQIGILVLTILWAGTSCKHDEYNFPIVPIDIEDLVPVRVNSELAIAERSNEDYNLNTHGLITESTLQRWWENWPQNRPKEILGNLVLIHTASGNSANDFVIPRESEGIYSYSLPNAMQVLGESRSNGVIETIDMVATGDRFQSILARFGVNPSRDLIVFIPDGVGANPALWMALRGWYTFRYWGVDGRNLAVLNGGVSAILPNSMRSTRLSPEGLGTEYSIARRKVDNTILQATLEDMMRYVDGRESYPTGIYIVDARTAAEYNANRGSGSPPWNFTPSANAQPESIAFEGHIKGAANLPFVELLSVTTGSGPTAGRKFKSLSELETIFANSSGYAKGKLVLSYCRTNVRSMVTGFANVAILGNPTRFYDGSWIEWGSLSGRAETGITQNLAANSPWRTDTEAYTENLSYNIPTGGTPPSNLPSGVAYAVLPQINGLNTKVEKRVLTNFEIFSKDAKKAIKDDKAFLRGKGGTSSFNRPARPGNPCG